MRHFIVQRRRRTKLLVAQRIHVKETKIWVTFVNRDHFQGVDKDGFHIQCCAQAICQAVGDIHLQFVFRHDHKWSEIMIRGLFIEASVAKVERVANFLIFCISSHISSFLVFVPNEVAVIKESVSNRVTSSIFLGRWLSGENGEKVREGVVTNLQGTLRNIDLANTSVDTYPCEAFHLDPLFLPL